MNDIGHQASSSECRSRGLDLVEHEVLFVVSLMLNSARDLGFAI